MVQKTIAKVADAQGSPVAVAIEVSGHHLFGDEPVNRGGADRGPTPFDLLPAALAACTAMTVRWYAAQKGWPLDHVSVEVEHGKKIQAGVGEVIDHFSKRVSIIGSELTAEQRHKLMEISEKCPVHKTLTGQIMIETLPDPSVLTQLFPGDVIESGLL